MDPEVFKSVYKQLIQGRGELSTVTRRNSVVRIQA